MNGTLLPQSVTRNHSEILTKKTKELKADRLHPPDYPHKHPDYRHTDKVYGLIIVLLAPNLRTDRQTDATNSIISLLR